MEFKVETWTIHKLLQVYDQIDLAPAYQRGPAWKPERQALLLDSIFNGYDLPKIYIARKKSGHLYEVIDGQQRIKTLHIFHQGEKLLNPESLGRGVGNHKLSINDLSAIERKTFDDYKLTISIVEDATPSFKRALFTRLQLGEHLNSAELRNALASSAPRQFRSIAQTHTFFGYAGIKDSRYQRDDYLTHVFALLDLDGIEGWKDIKALKLKQFVLAKAKGISAAHLERVDIILTFMEQIALNTTQTKPFRNKWSFVDAFMYCNRNHTRLNTLNVNLLGNRFLQIESFRKKYYKGPEELLKATCAVSHKKLLYDYIAAFKAGGAMRENIEIREKYLNKVIAL